MRDALLTIGLFLAIVAGGLLFEMGGQYRILSAYILPTRLGRVEPTYRIRPSIRHALLCGLAAYAALRGSGLQMPIEIGYAFLGGVVVWLTMFLWSVGREAARQRTATSEE